MGRGTSNSEIENDKKRLDAFRKSVPKVSYPGFYHLMILLFKRKGSCINIVDNIANCNVGPG